MSVTAAEVQAKINAAIEAARQLERSREASLVVTKLEEAELWLSQVSK